MNDKEVEELLSQYGPYLYKTLIPPLTPIQQPNSLDYKLVKCSKHTQT